MLSPAGSTTLSADIAAGRAVRGTGNAQALDRFRNQFAFDRPFRFGQVRNAANDPDRDPVRVDDGVKGLERVEAAREVEQQRVDGRPVLQPVRVPGETGILANV